MQRKLTKLWILVAVSGVSGCVAPSRLTKHAMNEATSPFAAEQATAPQNLRPSAVLPRPAIAQVSHTEEQALSGQPCGPEGMSLNADLESVPTVQWQSNPGIAGSVPCSAGCGCQSCGTKAFADSAFPTAYFNPSILDPNEFICDGGDNEPAARARVGDQIIGVELEDTVVRYTTDAGSVHVQPSNKVCVYSPRFASVRKVTGAESGDMAVGAVGVERPLGPINAQLNQPGLAVTGRDKLGRGSAVRGPDAMRARDRGVPVERVLHPEQAQDVLTVLENLALVHRGLLRDTEKPWLSNAAQAAIAWSVDAEVAVTVNDIAPVTLIRDQNAQELFVYDFPDAGRLQICKLADKFDALPGEEITFFIRVDNVGDSSVRNVVITDSLVTRLEYVTDSQKVYTDESVAAEKGGAVPEPDQLDGPPQPQRIAVEAAFTSEANEGQSLRLTWKLAKELKVGEGATIEFKCKVR